MTCFELSGDRLVARGLRWAYEGREDPGTSHGASSQPAVGVTAL
jgi:hypothetical protein